MISVNIRIIKVTSLNNYQLRSDTEVSANMSNECTLKESPFLERLFRKNLTTYLRWNSYIKPIVDKCESLCTPERTRNILTYSIYRRAIISDYTALWVMNSILSLEVLPRRLNVVTNSLIYSYIPGRYSGELHFLTPAGRTSRLGHDMLLKMRRHIFILCQASSSQQPLHCGVNFQLDVSFITENLIS